jgi:hypothetical protein
LDEPLDEEGTAFLIAETDAVGVEDAPDFVVVGLVLPRSELVGPLTVVED